MSPVSETLFNADLAIHFGLPILVVVPNVLGAINQALQTLISASTFCEGLGVAGLVLNHLREQQDDLSMSTNRAELEARCVPPVLATLPYGATRWGEPVDWLGCTRTLSPIGSSDKHV